MARKSRIKSIISSKTDQLQDSQRHSSILESAKCSIALRDNACYN